MATALYSNATMKHNKLIQHSHSPCITPHYIVSKLDSFGPRLKPSDTGMLKEVQQIEDDLWMVMDRRTNSSKLVRSNLKFVNNHFWNCVENEAGEIVVGTVPATSDYLDTYFKRSLSETTVWERIIMPPQMCTIPSDISHIHCETLLKGVNNETVFDYPTFNPRFKMRADYRYFYAIAPKTPAS